MMTLRAVGFFHFMFPPTLHNHMNAVICVVIEILTHHASWKVSKLHFSVNGALSDSYSWGGRLFSGERSLKSRSGGLKVMGTDSVFQVWWRVGRTYRMSGTIPFVNYVFFPYIRCWRHNLLPHVVWSCGTSLFYLMSQGSKSYTFAAQTDPPNRISVTFIWTAWRNMGARVPPWEGSANEAYVSSQVNIFFWSQNHFPYTICSLTPTHNTYIKFSFICRPSSLSPSYYCL